MISAGKCKAKLHVENQPWPGGAERFRRVQMLHACPTKRSSCNISYGKVAKQLIRGTRSLAGCLWHYVAEHGAGDRVQERVQNRAQER